MINTGLLLRRPFESDYNAFRRFLVANQTRSYHSLRADLVRNFASRLEPKPGMEEMAKRVEEQYCEQYGIPYFEPESSLSGIKHRNCRECARLCYHSYLYDLPWLMLCPVHQRRLFSSCPECDQPWPTYSELPKRACRVCGIHLGSKYLATIDATQPFESLSGFSVLADLHAAVQKEKTKPQLGLTGGGTGLDEYVVHSPLDPTNVDWPSLACPRTPEWREICDAVGAPLLPVCERQFKIAAPVSGASSGQDMLSRSENFKADCAIRRRGRRRVGRVLRRLCLPVGSSLSNLRIQCGDLQALTPQEISKISFKRWRALISRQRAERNVANRGYFIRPEFIDPPFRPVVLSSIQVDRRSEPNFFSRGAYRPQSYAISHDLKIWFYEIELWRTYLAILGHLNTFNAALLQGLTWNDYYDRLPQDAVAGNSSKARIWFELPTPNTLRIVMPYRHVFISEKTLLDSLSLIHYGWNSPFPAEQFGKARLRPQFELAHRLNLEKARDLKTTLDLIELLEKLFP